MPAQRRRFDTSLSSEQSAASERSGGGRASAYESDTPCSQPGQSTGSTPSTTAPCTHVRPGSPPLVSGEAGRIGTVFLVLSPNACCGFRCYGFAALLDVSCYGMLVSTQCKYDTSQFTRSDTVLAQGSARSSELVMARLPSPLRGWLTRACTRGAAGPPSTLPDNRSRAFTRHTQTQTPSD